MNKRAGTLLPALLAAGLAAMSVADENGTGAAGMLAAYPFSAASSEQWKLPDKLNEISGLALTADRRLLGITDETAIVYELDYEEGRLVKAFALGEPVVKGDFEGIATADGRVWLVTSRGDIFESREGEDGERVDFARYETGLGRQCEIEGLAYRRTDEVLLVLCKGLKRGSDLDRLAIFAWSTRRQEVLADDTILLPDGEIAMAIRSNRLQPSGIAIEERSGHLFIVAARQRAVIELDPAGRFLFATVLPLASRHRQAEGIEMLPTGELLIADEGGGHRARLAIYRPERGSVALDD